MTPAAVIALACVKHRRAPLLAGAVQYARSSLVSMQKQTSPSREADNDVRDALESIVLQIEGPEEPRDTKVVSDAHGMVHLSEAVKDTMPPLFSSTMLVPTVGDALELTRGDVYTIGKSNEIVFFGAYVRDDHVIMVALQPQHETNLLFEVIRSDLDVVIAPPARKQCVLSKMNQKKASGALAKLKQESFVDKKCTLAIRRGNKPQPERPEPEPSTALAIVKPKAEAKPLAKRSTTRQNPTSRTRKRKPRNDGNDDADDAGEKKRASQAAAARKYRQKKKQERELPRPQADPVLAEQPMTGRPTTIMTRPSTIISHDAHSINPVMILRDMQQEQLRELKLLQQTQMAQMQHFFAMNYHQQ